MNKKDDISVTNPSHAFVLGLVLTGLVIILITLYTIFSEPPHYPMYITFTLLVFIPGILVMSWLKLFKVTVTGQKITVRRGTGLKYHFDVSEITKVDCKITNTKIGQTAKITVRTASKHFSIDNLMIGFAKTSEYILNNVDESKVKIQTKTFVN